MTESEILTTPEHLLEIDTSVLTKEKASSVLRGLVAYEIRAHLGSEHKNLQPYLGKLQRKRLELVDLYVSLGGEVAQIVMSSELPKWNSEQRPAIGTLVKTKNSDLYGT